MVNKALLGLIGLSGLLGWFLWGAIQDKAAMAAQLELALSANTGLSESRQQCEARQRKLVADLKSVAKERDDAIRMAQNDEAAADAELARLRQNLRGATNDPESCLHATLPDALFAGLSAEGD